jgi:hypothetical protein
VDAQGRLTAASSSSAIVDADVSGTAAIAQSKIQNLSSDLSSINSILSGKEASITAGTTAQ